MDQIVNQSAPDQKNKAIAGFIFGVFGLVTLFTLGVSGIYIGAPLILVVGLILSGMGLKSSKRGWAIAGIVLCVIGLFISVIVVSYFLCHLGSVCVPYISDFLLRIW